MTSIELANHADAVFKALASKPRRQILAILASGGGADDARCCGPDEICACVFAEKLDLGAPTVSHHMKTLLDAGLVSASKRGLWVYYRLVPGALESVAGEFATLMGASVTWQSPGCGCEADSAQSIAVAK
jgi:ArsR family transcriptional regulator